MQASLKKRVLCIAHTIDSYLVSFQYLINSLFYLCLLETLALLFALTIYISSISCIFHMFHYEKEIIGGICHQ